MQLNQLSGPGSAVLKFMNMCSYNITQHTLEDHVHVAVHAAHYAAAASCDEVRPSDRVLK